mgnify:FL=1
MRLDEWVRVNLAVEGVKMDWVPGDINFERVAVRTGCSRHVTQKESDYITAAEALKASKGHMGSFYFPVKGGRN